MSMSHLASPSWQVDSKDRTPRFHTRCKPMSLCSKHIPGSRMPSIAKSSLPKHPTSAGFAETSDWAHLLDSCYRQVRQKHASLGRHPVIRNSRSLKNGHHLMVPNHLSFLSTPARQLRCQLVTTQKPAANRMCKPAMQRFSSHGKVKGRSKDP